MLQHTHFTAENNNTASGFFANRQLTSEAKKEVTSTEFDAMTINAVIESIATALKDATAAIKEKNLSSSVAKQHFKQLTKSLQAYLHAKELYGNLFTKENIARCEVLIAEADPVGKALAAACEGKTTAEPKQSKDKKPSKTKGDKSVLSQVFGVGTPEPVVTIKPATPKSADAINQLLETSAPVLAIDGVDLTDDDIAAVRLARLAKPVMAYMTQLVKTGKEFAPSAIYEVGEAYGKMLNELKSTLDADEELAFALTQTVPVMVKFMDSDNPTQEEIDNVHAIVDQMDAMRDVYLADQVRNLQTKAESLPGETAQAREVNQLDGK